MTTLVPLWTAAALTAPAVSRSLSDRTSSWVSPIHMSSILAWPATRTERSFLPTQTEVSDSLVGPDARRRGQPDQLLAALLPYQAHGEPMGPFQAMAFKRVWISL